MDHQNGAFKLYLEGWQQKDIAELINKSEKTISEWVKKGNWKEKRQKEVLFKETAAGQVRQLINHQLTVLSLIAQKQSEDLDKNLDIATLQSRLISKGDVDGLSKLYASIKGKEAEWDVIVRNIKEFTEYLESENIKLAKELLPYASGFLDEKRRKA